MNMLLRSLWCSALFLSGAAVAQTDYYGGIVFNRGGDILSPIAFAAHFSAPPALSDTGLLSSTTQPYQIRIGYEYSRRFGVEAEYSSSTRVTFPISLAPAPTVGALSGNNPKGFSVDAVGTLPFWYRFAVLGKAGIRRVTVDNEATVFTHGSLTQGKLGLGLQYNFSRSLGFRAEVERYRNLGAERGIADTDGDALSFGVLYRF